ncbi:MAG: HD domain-containing protein, partial [Bacteroidota bacterium]
RIDSSTSPGNDEFQVQPIDLPPEVARLPLQERSGSWAEIIQADAKRRDFTCNTLLHNIENGEIIDPTGQGLADLENKILRTVSPDSFRDDPLRILRGLARVSRDGMQFDPETEEQAKGWVHQANHTSGSLSAERVQGELQKILAGTNSTGAFELLRDWDAIDGVLPGWGECVGFDQQSRYHSLDVDRHMFQALRYADRQGYSPSMKMAVLLHDIGKPPTAKPGKDGYLHYYQAAKTDPLWQSNPTRAKAHETVGAEMTREILNGLRYPETEKDQIVYLVQHHMFSEERDFFQRPPAKQENIARRMLYRHGIEQSELLLQLRACDLNGKKESPTAGWDKDIIALSEMLEQQKHQPHRLEHLCLNGGDIISMGAKPGPQVGDVLRNLLKQVVGDPGANTPDRLKRIARGLIQASAE